MIEGQVCTIKVSRLEESAARQGPVAGLGCMRTKGMGTELKRVGSKR